MGLNYVDIFYHHRPDPDTPLEETMGALADIVRQGKALYVGISNYKARETQKAAELLRASNTPFILNQVNYSMLDRWIEDALLERLTQNNLGCIAFSPLAQGMLTDRYLEGIPKTSRAAKDFTYLEAETVNSNTSKIKALHAIAVNRGQKLSQMAIAWILRQPQVASVLIGASSPAQLKENVKALEHLKFTDDELTQIDHVIS
jgi:L-glyceraldehyde 3-phosphate reductase